MFLMAQASVEYCRLETCNLKSTGKATHSGCCLIVLFCFLCFSHFNARHYSQTCNHSYSFLYYFCKCDRFCFPILKCNEKHLDSSCLARNPREQSFATGLCSSRQHARKPGRKMSKMMYLLSDTNLIKLSILRVITKPQCLNLIRVDVTAK